MNRRRSDKARKQRRQRPRVQLNEAGRKALEQLTREREEALQMSTQSYWGERRRLGEEQKRRRAAVNERFFQRRAEIERDFAAGVTP